MVRYLTEQELEPYKLKMIPPLKDLTGLSLAGFNRLKRAEKRVTEQNYPSLAYVIAYKRHRDNKFFYQIAIELALPETDVRDISKLLDIPNPPTLPSSPVYNNETVESVKPISEFGISFKACPKCHGDMYPDKDKYGVFITCLQCGNDRVKVA